MMSSSLDVSASSLDTGSISTTCRRCSAGSMPTPELATCPDLAVLIDRSNGSLCQSKTYTRELADLTKFHTMYIHITMQATSRPLPSAYSFSLTRIDNTKVEVIRFREYKILLDDAINTKAKAIKILESINSLVHTNQGPRS